ncbi:Uncharacterised protein [uncultured archaeon]|nr:Uncharacterised protein [uncultured archaeon]
MIAVGFTWPLGWDNSVAAIVDGRLVFASEEGRHTRQRMSMREPPANAFFAMFRFLEKEHGIKPRDIDTFAVNRDPSKMNLMGKTWALASASNSVYSFTSSASFTDHIDFGMGRFAGALGKSVITGRPSTEMARLFIEAIYRRMGLSAPERMRVIPVDFHLSYAASAHYFSGHSSDAVILPVDRERESATVWSVKGGEFEKLLSMPRRLGSIKLLYGKAAVLSGLGPGLGLGLVPYGARDGKLRERFMSIIKSSDRLPYYFEYKDLFKRSPLRSALANDYARERTYALMKELLRGMDFKWKANGEINRQAADLALCVQDVTDGLMMRLARWAKENTGERKLSLAGSIAMNSRSNMKISDSKLFSDVFAFTASNDGGGVPGAAAYVYEHVLGGRMRRDIPGEFRLGPKYGEERVKKAVLRGKWNASNVGDDLGEVAEIAAKGGVVCWFNGRSEFGARALGGRSVIADPTRSGAWRKVNDITGRKWWRPLAPSVRYEDMKRYFGNSASVPAMMQTLRLTDKGAARLPAVNAPDGIIEVQSVKKRENERWYGLIGSFGEISGEEAIVNTGFHLGNEPFVETPEDAIRSFGLGGFDAMYIDGWLLRKR